MEQLEPSSPEGFRHASLDLLAGQLALHGAYPGYARQRLFVAGGALRTNAGRVTLPIGFDAMRGSVSPDPEECRTLQTKGLELDYPNSRPLHPWADAMIRRQDVGILTGKGVYRYWGPNYTADPIVIRRDLKIPHVLLIERDDGTGWALPGGFVDPNENPINSAKREAREETGIDVEEFEHKLTTVYTGPVVDLRNTVNAWPETTACSIELDLSKSGAQKKLAQMMAKHDGRRFIRFVGRRAFRQTMARLPWTGGDDARYAAWVPEDKCGSLLFGSHSLLVALALTHHEQR